MGQYEKYLDNLRVNADREEASKLNRIYRHDTASNVNNMYDQNQNVPTRTSSSRRNIVIEGLNDDSESEILAEFLSLTGELKVIVYKADIDEIFRMKCRNERIKTPGPVLVKLNRTSVRDSIMKNKASLKTSETRSKVFISPDEPLEVRRTKAIFRRVATKAKEYGEEVQLRYDCIWIAGVQYTHDELYSIPAKYLHGGEKGNGDQDDSEAEAYEGAQATSVWITPDRPTVKMDKSIEALTAELIKPGEKMRITKYGLLFSGPTAYPSNKYKAPINFQQKEYKTNEHSFQCTKAERHDRKELAEALKEIPTAYEVKIEGGKIVTSEAWNDQAPDLLWDMFDQKMKNNPDLLARLLKTSPLPLIEASNSSKCVGGGGGGAPFSSKLYDTGKFRGQNVFRDTAMRYRDMKINELEENQMA